MSKEFLSMISMNEGKEREDRMKVKGERMEGFSFVVGVKQQAGFVGERYMRNCWRDRGV